MKKRISLFLVLILTVPAPRSARGRAGQRDFAALERNAELRAAGRAGRWPAGRAAAQPGCGPGAVSGRRRRHRADAGPPAAGRPAGARRGTGDRRRHAVGL